MHRTEQGYSFSQDGVQKQRGTRTQTGEPEADTASHVETRREVKRDISKEKKKKKQKDRKEKQQAKETAAYSL